MIFGDFGSRHAISSKTMLASSWGRCLLRSDIFEYWLVVIFAMVIAVLQWMSLLVCRIILNLIIIKFTNIALVSFHIWNRSWQQFASSLFVALRKCKSVFSVFALIWCLPLLNLRWDPVTWFRRAFSHKVLFLHEHICCRGKAEKCFAPPLSRLLMRWECFKFN